MAHRDGESVHEEVERVQPDRGVTGIKGAVENGAVKPVKHGVDAGDRMAL